MQGKPSNQSIKIENQSQFLQDYSKFGIYSVEKNLELHFPYSEIEIKKQYEKKYTYNRKDHENNVQTQLLTTKTEPLKIHIAPIGALHKPSAETKNMFLRFNQNVLIEKDSKIELSIPCPIEIGVFRVTDGKHILLDSFPCQPLHSRFAIYGQADTGILCKYAQVLPDVLDPEPYIYGTMNVKIKNEKEMDVVLGKIVFPLSDLDVYYNKNKTIFDGLDVVLKDTPGKLLPLAEISVNTLDVESEWKKTPSIFTKDKTNFVMHEGFD